MTEGIIGGVARPDPRRVLPRETAISVVINAVLSALFFLGVFGLGGPVALASLGPDFYPQTFMITLMGTLVPGLLLRRQIGGPAGAVIVRAVAMAVLAAVVLGTLCWWLCARDPAATLAAGRALALKIIYGGVLAAVVTPLALAAQFRRTRA